MHYFGNDVDIPAAWEPGGNDFLSPSLAEADLMRRVLPPAEFAPWFHRFLPGRLRRACRNRFRRRRPSPTAPTRNWFTRTDST